MLAHDRADRGADVHDAERAGLPHDPQVSPTRVLPRQLQHQCQRRANLDPLSTLEPTRRKGVSVQVLPSAGAVSHPRCVQRGWPARGASICFRAGAAANDYGVAADVCRRQIAGCLLR
jgi:hypothetical protein